VSGYLEVTKNHKNVLNADKEIHQKFQEICETRSKEKIKRLSKLLVFNDKDQITDKDLYSSEAYDFFSSNKREFGLPLMNIKGDSQKKIIKRKSMDLDIGIEESIIQEIHFIRSKQLSLDKTISKLSPIKAETGRAKLDVLEENNKKMSTLNRFIYSEMKKLDPVSANRVFMKNNDAKLRSIRKREAEHKKYEEQYLKCKISII
jgi:hypothetical protein